VAVATTGDVYVVETAARQVLRLAPDGRELARWGEAGAGDGQFGEPVAVLVDSAGLVHVLDAEQGRVQVFTPDGGYQRQYGGEQGLYYPRGLALGDDGLIYLADTGGNRVLRFQPDGQLRNVIPAQRDQQPPLLEQPTAAVRAGAVLYVAEPTRHQISRRREDGQPVAPPWPVIETDTVRAARLVLGPAGEVVVADVGGGRVVLVCPGRDRLLAWSLPDEARPLGAALTPDRQLYVVDDAGRLLRVRFEGGC
jgi:sugar lactone lactonase YvrE